MSWGDPVAFGLLLALGAMTGFISGLLGVGGGTIVVPALLFGLPLFGISGPEMPKIAMATSLALVIPTTFASAQAHAARRGIDWYLWSLLAPGIVAGAIFTALFAAKLNNELLILLFITLVLWTAWKLMVPASRQHSQTSKRLPVMLITLKSVLGGALSSLLGLGVGWFTVPMMARFTAMPKAIGLSAVLTAPFGAWAAHVMPVAALKRVFAAFLIIVAGDLAYKMYVPAKFMHFVQETLAQSHLPASHTQPQAAPVPTWLLNREQALKTDGLSPR
jgi:uncharacterized protein